MQNSDSKPTTYKTLKEKLSRAFPFFVACLSLWLGYMPAQAQVHEIGIGLGAANYVGDLMPQYTYRNHRLAGQAFYRYNLTDPVTLRGNLWAGKLTGEDNTNYDFLNQTRNREKFDITAFEFAALIEYNFFNYRHESGLIRWSPYFVGGIGFTYLSGLRNYDSSQAPETAYSNGYKTADFSSFQPVVPLGIGVKYAITPQWTVGAEWIARKTFTDYLDNTGALENNAAYNQTSFELGNSRHKDWYFFTGINLSYTIWTIPCPFDYE